MPTARFANSDHTDVAYDPGDGAALIALKPEDERLQGLTIAPYEAPPPPPEPPLADLLAELDALRARIEARLSAG